METVKVTITEEALTYQVQAIGGSENAIVKRSAIWFENENFVLGAAQFGVETDTRLFKIGPGAWNDLPYHGVSSGTTGKISGGGIDVVGDDVTVAIVAYSISGHGVFSTSAPTLFNNIALSSAGTQRYIGYFGNTSGVIIKVEGAEGAVASQPSTPADTCPIGYVLVTDGAIGTPVEASPVNFADIAGNASSNASLVAYITTRLNAHKPRMIAINYTDSSAITGTTSEMKIGTGLLIPANTFQVGDIVQMRSTIKITSASGTQEYKFYINTSDSLSGASQVGRSTGGVSFLGLVRHMMIKSSSNSEVMSAAVSSTGDIPGSNTTGTAISSLNVDWTVDQYIITSYTPGSVGSSGIRSLVQVTKQ